MGEILFFGHLHIEAERQHVLTAMDCFPDSPMYDEICDEYDEVYEELAALCRPVALAAFTKLEDGFADAGIPAGSGILCVLRSLGFEASALSGRYFAAGDCLKGMLADKLADALLFSMEKELNPQLAAACRRRGKGIDGRFDPPNQVPMTAQRLIFEETGAQERLGFRLSSGLMVDPQKSCTSLYVLTDDTDRMLVGHDCRRCKNRTCRNRRHYGGNVTAEGRGVFPVEDGQTLLQALRAAGVYIPAVCGGAGRCGKCAVMVLSGNLPPSDADRSFFTREELEAGRRLACTAVPEGDCTIRLDGDGEERFDVAGTAAAAGQAGGRPCVLAVDIGTTTITVALAGKADGAILSAVSFVNRQRAYGADVISRQSAAVAGQAQALRACVCAQLLDGFREALEKAGAAPENVEAVGIAGNTTMIHLLMGWPCDGLGRAPFTAHSLALTSAPFRTVFDSDFLGCDVTIMPGISTYVGGDIVSGLLRYAVDTSEKPVLLLDLGTNGEMALGDRSGIVCTSTAAGPAFEGGNISCGTGSVPGAICSVRIEDGRAQVRTIGEKPPVGICGTGVIETAAELVRTGLVDETGRLDETYFDDGFPLAAAAGGQMLCFAQKDVREIQLAKAAVRAGLETLLLRRGIGYGDISAVLLAGGFGYRTDTEKAAVIGMLPRELLPVTRAVGNSSLDGAVMLLTQAGAAARAKTIADGAREIGLAADADFSRLYMEHMAFDESPV